MFKKNFFVSVQLVSVENWRLSCHITDFSCAISKFYCSSRSDLKLFVKSFFRLSFVCLKIVGFVSAS